MPEKQLTAWLEKLKLTSCWATGSDMLLAMPLSQGYAAKASSWCLACEI